MKEFYQKRIEVSSLRHPERYSGSNSFIDIRSSYESVFVQQLDSNSSVLEWSNEEIIIPYYSVIDKRKHRYFVDFYVKLKDKNGNEKKYLIEIKPYKETIRPDFSGKKRNSTKLEEARRFMINQKKWEAANEFARQNGMIFKIVTEKELGI